MARAAARSGPSTRTLEKRADVDGFAGGNFLFHLRKVWRKKTVRARRGWLFALALELNKAEKVFGVFSFVTIEMLNENIQRVRIVGEFLKNP